MTANRFPRRMTCAALIWLSGGLVAPAWPGQAWNVYETMALGRLKVIKELQRPFNETSWPGFDPSAAPAVILDPEGGALAVNFSEPPAGFKPIKKAGEGEQQIFRAAPGVFTQETDSPALVAGEWAVISRIDPAAAAPDGARLGRRSAEEWIADFVGDAFLAHLTKVRKPARPYVVGAAAYPDSAELMALTTLEHRLLLQSIVMGFDETNVDQFHRLVRHLIAVRRARWKMMGPDLAGLEQAMENWDGLRLYITAQVYRQAISKGFSPPPIAHVDATSAGFDNSLMFRLMITNLPLTFTPDSPAATRSQVAHRGGSLAFLVERLSREWYPKAEPGDRALIDLLNELVELKPEEEAAFLEEAKTRHFYSTALRLAREDLERSVRGREQTLARDFPPGRGRLEIRLKGERVAAYLDDPVGQGYLGGGMLAHPGRLEIHGPGMDLGMKPIQGAARPRVLTAAKARRDELTGITLNIPEGASITIGGEAYHADGKARRLTSLAPFRLTAEGLELRVSSGTLKSGRDGMEILPP